MAVPVLLVTGFLGAGKTSAINHILRAPHGLRLAALVNDFGAINIDAELVGGSADGVVDLRNGCICCSLQGDMLRSIAGLLRRDPKPEGIVIETSGVSDPAEIVRSLLDPVIFKEAALEAVVCLADARALADGPMEDDALARSQLLAADFIALNKVDLVSPAELADVRARLARLKPNHVVFDITQGALPIEALLGTPAAPRHTPGNRLAAGVVTPRFESMSWTAGAPLSMQLFQAAIGRLAPRLVRAKGVLRFTGQANPMVFQMVGRRATLAAADPAAPAGSRLVLIAEAGALDQPAATAALEACLQT